MNLPGIKNMMLVQNRETMVGRRIKQKNKNERIKKETLLKSIEEDEELHDNDILAEKQISKMNLLDPSHIEVIIMDAKKDIEKRKERVLGMVRTAKMLLNQICRVQVNSLPKKLQDMTLEELENEVPGFDIFAAAMKVCDDQVIAQKHVAQKRPFEGDVKMIQTPVPSSAQTKLSLFDGFTPKTTVRKQRQGESIKEAALMGV